MIKTIQEWEFIDEFDGQYANNFTYEGKQALFEYLEQYEDDTDEQIELDVVALCCEYTEYNDLKELQENYNNIENMDDLRDNTQVIEIDGTDRFIIQNF